MLIKKLIRTFFPGIILSSLVFVLIYPLISLRPQILGISYSVSEQDLLSNINSVRKNNGLSDLQINEKLQMAAQDKANDMLSRNYWSHYSPDGATPWYFISKDGYKYTYAGENLAEGFNSSGDAFNAWMKSAGHKANILSKDYTDTGFAIIQGKLQGKDTVLIVEMFGSQNKNQNFN